MRAKAYPQEDPKTLPTPESILPAYLYLMGEDSLALNGQSIDAGLKVKDEKAKLNYGQSSNLACLYLKRYTSLFYY